MTDPFDFLTVACFLALVVAFFVWTDRDLDTLLHLSICGVAFAVANQLGRSGYTIFALILIATGTAYALFVISRKRTGGSSG
jgi:hypothetical protein